jgi:hypothetical protein
MSTKTLVTLGDAQLKELRSKARREGRSVAALMREAVASYLARPSASGLDGFVGCAEGPPDDDTSERADDVLKGMLG